MHDEEKRRSRELMEKAAEDNERMMGAIATLFEKNQMQTWLLAALSHFRHLRRGAPVVEIIAADHQRRLLLLPFFSETSPNAMSSCLISNPTRWMYGHFVSLQLRWLRLLVLEEGC